MVRLWRIARPRIHRKTDGQECPSYTMTVRPTHLSKRRRGCHADADESFTQLFLKPEDAWELNNIAEQKPEQITLMRDSLGVEGSIKFWDSL